MTALTGLMLGCGLGSLQVRPENISIRHAENYQISQYDQPICVGGAVPLHEFAYPRDAQKNMRAREKRCV